MHRVLRQMASLQRAAEHGHAIAGEPEGEAGETHGDQRQDRFRHLVFAEIDVIGGGVGLQLA